jgi:hypothetical protein
MIANEVRNIAYTYNVVERSMISKQYASRFIREFILEEKNEKDINNSYGGFVNI